MKILPVNQLNSFSNKKEKTNKINNIKQDNVSFKAATGKYFDLVRKYDVVEVKNLNEYKALFIELRNAVLEEKPLCFVAEGNKIRDSLYAAIEYAKTCKELITLVRRYYDEHALVVAQRGVVKFRIPNNWTTIDFSKDNGFYDIHTNHYYTKFWPSGGIKEYYRWSNGVISDQRFYKENGRPDTFKNLFAL